MEYRWKLNTINARRGDVRALNPNCANTAILLQNGIIEPVENKAMDVPEVKAAPKRGRRAVKSDE